MVSKINGCVVVCLSLASLSMKTLTIHDSDYAKVLQLLSEHGIEAEPTPEQSIPLLRKSDANPDETPRAFGSIWETDERTMASIRARGEV